MKKWLALFLVLMLLLICTACGDNEAADIAPDSVPTEDTTLTEPEEVDWEWQKDSPDNQGLNAAALTGIHATYDSFPLHAAVIVKNGYIVDEYYKEGYDENSMFVLNSASKSVTSALIGIAIDKGYIESVDVLLADYFPEVAEFADDRWQDITLWHLLTHTSGISSTDSALWYEWRSSDNWLEYIFNLPIVSTPGREFSYSTGNTHLLTAILQRATGMTAYDFGKQYLFDPLGMDTVRCDLDAQGISDGGNGFWFNIYDMAQFGQLYLNDGAWEGEQLISQQWVRDSTTLQFDRSSGSADYGYQWWVRTFGSARYPAFFAQGHGGQYIFVVPDLELIVAFTSDYTGQTGIYWQLVADIVAACSE